MCGICGLINVAPRPPADVGLLKRMLGTLHHRGPDSSGYYRDEQAALAHSRLAIIDLKSGAQPLSNEDGSLWISFNGEIFNYLELAEELSGLGHVFSTRSDTEVIVHAFEEWGSSCFSRFNGQWAIALWDRRNRRLILSRDRMGIRPLYYTIHDGRLRFASEIKAIFADPEVPREFSPEGLSQVYTFWGPVAPATAFRNIFEIEPGHFAVLENGELRQEAYWSMNYSGTEADESMSIQEAAEQLRHHLVEASRLRFTRSDVPVASYLSGGIDSSITSAIVSRYTPTRLKTFSLRFTDAEFDEGKYQEEMVRHLQADHQTIQVSHGQIGEIFPEVIRHTERPILRTAPAPLYLLSKLVRESGYKVVVTGEGSDEVLAGYDIFKELKARLFIARNPDSEKRKGIVYSLYPWMERSPNKAPAFSRAFFGKCEHPEDPGFSHQLRWNTSSTIQLLLHPELQREMAKHDVVNDFLSRLPEEHVSWDALERAQWLEAKSLLAGYILSAQGDRMLMANSVEGRFPFLDVNLVEFASTLPPAYKIFGLDEKHILKAAFKDLIPASILQRPKQPYRSPDASSFFAHGKIHEWIGDITSEDALRKSGIFNPGAVTKIMEKCRRTGGSRMSNTDNMRVVAVLSTLLLHHDFIETGFTSGTVPAQPDKVVDLVEHVASANTTHISSRTG